MINKASLAKILEVPEEKISHWEWITDYDAWNVYYVGEEGPVVVTGQQLYGLEKEQSPVPDAEPEDAYDQEWINDLNEAWLAFHPGEELPPDAS